MDWYHSSACSVIRLICMTVIHLNDITTVGLILTKPRLLKCTTGTHIYYQFWLLYGWTKIVLRLQILNSNSIHIALCLWIIILIVKSDIQNWWFLISRVNLAGCLFYASSLSESCSLHNLHDGKTDRQT